MATSNFKESTSRPGRRDLALPARQGAPGKPQPPRSGFVRAPKLAEGGSDRLFWPKFGSWPVATGFWRAPRVGRVVNEGVKRATYHTFPHSFAAHLREDGTDIRTLRERLVPDDISTTMVYTHVLDRRPLGVTARSIAFGTASPPDRAMAGGYRAGPALGASGRRVGKDRAERAG